MGAPKGPNRRSPSPPLDIKGNSTISRRARTQKESSSSKTCEEAKVKLAAAGDDKSMIEPPGLDDHKKHTTHKKTNLLLLHPTYYTLPLLVMIDMFSVSLVVPLLQQYYKDAGVTSSSQRELLSSLFSSSQIVGGILLGALADAQVVSRRTILLLSFGGSAIAYGFIGFANSIMALLVSRILVGLVKQTMTVSMTLLAQSSSSTEHRALHMGRIHASSTISWIVGPSVGAMLYKHVHHKAPALLAVALFLVNMVLAAVLLPNNQDSRRNDEQPRTITRSDASKSKFSSFASNLKACFVSPALGSAILSMLLFTWFARATSYASLANYYEDMYDLEPHHRGYLSSYQQLLSFLVQSLLVGPIISYSGGERKAAVLAACVMAAATLCEYQGNLHVFLFLVAPLVSLCMATMSLSLRSLITHVAPNKESLGSVLAALDVLQNATAVTVPFYRTLLFSLLSSPSAVDTPSPTIWVVSSFVHWAVAATAMGTLLLLLWSTPSSSLKQWQQPQSSSSVKKTI